MMKISVAVWLCLSFNVNVVSGFKLVPSINIKLNQVNESPLKLRQTETSTLSLDSVLVGSNLESFQNIFSISKSYNSTDRRKSTGSWNKFSIPKSGSGMGSAINDFIIQYFTDSKYTDNNGILKKKTSVGRLQSFLKQYNEQLNYVHIITLMYQCSRNRIPIHNFISLATLNKVLYSSLSRANKSAKGITSDNLKPTTESLVAITPNTSSDSSTAKLFIHVYKPREVSNVLYGFRSLFDPITDSNSNDYTYGTSNKKLHSTLSHEQLDVISTVTSIVSRSSNHSVFTGQEIASAFYGLYYLSSEHAVTRTLLSTLLDKLLWSMKVKLTSQETAMALNGLRHMSLEHIEVVQALEFLTNVSSTSINSDAKSLSSVEGVTTSIDNDAVKDVVLTMDEQYVGLALMGLQNMYTTTNTNKKNNNNNNNGKDSVSESGEVIKTPQSVVMSPRAQKAIKDVFSLLNTRLKQSNYTQLSGFTIASIFQGLRDIHTHHSLELNSLIITLSEKIVVCQLMSDINEDTAGQILGSFRSLSDTHVSTRKLIKSLNRHIQQSEFILHPRKFSHCISGLKNMVGNVVETKELLSILLSKVEKEEEVEINVIDGSNSNSNSSIVEVINGTISSVSNSAVASIAIVPYNKKTKTLLLTSSDVGRLLYGLQNMNARYNKPLQAVLQQVNTWLLRSTSLHLTGRDIGLALYGLKSQHYKDKVPIVQELIMTLAKKITDIPGSESALLIASYHYYLNAQSISMTMLGIQNMRSSQEEIELLLEGVTHRVHSVDAQSVGNILYAMRYMTTESKTVRHFISRLNTLLSKYCESINNNNNSNNSKHSNIHNHNHDKNRATNHNIPAATTQTSHTATRRFTTQEFANALWGMRGFDSKYPETIALLATLADQLYTQVLESNQLAKSQLRSQQRLENNTAQQQQQQKQTIANVADSSTSASSSTIPSSSSSTDATPTTAITTPPTPLQQSPPPHLSASALFLFSPQEISMALSGLQSMSASDGPAVLFMLGLLADRLELCREELKPGEIANILFGLQGMTAEYEEVRAVLAALLPKMKATTGIFTARDIGFSIAGLSNMEPAKLIYEEVWEIFEETNIKVGSSELRGQPELLFEVFANGGIKIGGK